MGRTSCLIATSGAPRVVAFEETVYNLSCLPHTVPGPSGHCSHWYRKHPNVFHFGLILTIVAEIVDITRPIISQSSIKCTLDHKEGFAEYQ